MAVNRRPIVYYEALRKNRYDQQVIEIMAAKTEYILFASADDVDSDEKVIKVEQLQPKVQPIVLIPKVKTQDANKVDVKTTQPEHVAETKQAGQSKLKHVDNMTGLGLSLDSIFGEETQVAQKNQSNYFKDSK